MLYSIFIALALCFVVNALVRQYNRCLCVFMHHLCAQMLRFENKSVFVYMSVATLFLSCVWLHAVDVRFDIKYTKSSCWFRYFELFAVVSLYVQHSANWNEGSFVISFRCRFLSRLHALVLSICVWHAIYVLSRASIVWLARWRIWIHIQFSRTHKCLFLSLFRLSCCLVSNARLRSIHPKKKWKKKLD